MKLRNGHAVLVSPVVSWQTSKGWSSALQIRWLSEQLAADGASKRSGQTNAPFLEPTNLQATIWLVGTEIYLLSKSNIL